MLERMRAPLLALLASILISCGIAEVLNDNTLLAGVAAYKATQAIIDEADEPEERADRIVKYTEEVVGFLESDTGVTIDLLYDYVHGLVMAQVPDVDRQPVEDLLLALREALAKEIGEFEILTPESTVSVLHIVERIRLAAVSAQSNSG